MFRIPSISRKYSNYYILSYLGLFGETLNQFQVKQASSFNWRKYVMRLADSSDELSKTSSWDLLLQLKMKKSTIT